MMRPRTLAMLAPLALLVGYAVSRLLRPSPSAALLLSAVATVAGLAMAANDYRRRRQLPPSSP